MGDDVAEAEGIGSAIGPDEGNESAAESATSDAVGLALALDAAHHDPQLGPAVRHYLNRQRVLVDLQIKHFDAEHTLAIAAARRKGFIDRMRICLQVLIATIIGALIIAVAVMLWDALNDRSVVIDALSVPEELTHQGFTGETAARRIIDRLDEINRASGTVRAANSYANSLGSGIKLEIPETGVSIGELSRVLHEKLGHTTHVGGEITHSGDTVTVRIRLGDEYEVESTGPQSTLSSLVQDAATRIYARTQPYRFGYWQFTNGDFTGAAATFRKLAIVGSQAERVWALHGLAVAAPTLRETARFDRQVLAIDPTFSISRVTLSNAELDMGHDEDALRDADRAVSATAERRDPNLSRRGLAALRADAASNPDVLLGDYLDEIANSDIVAANADTDEQRLAEWSYKIEALTQLHDLQAASDMIELLPPSDGARADERMSTLRALYSAAGGDWQSAITDLEHANTLLTALTERQREIYRHGFHPILAEAYARVGRAAEADATLALIPPDDYEGWCVRGRIATLRHDYAGAEKAFAEAVRQAPSIPRALLDWGDMLAAKGDLAGAVTKYTEANRLGPHWADPLKAWGDVLARQGQQRPALKQWRQALEWAPHWPQLQALVDAQSRR